MTTDYYTISIFQIRDVKALIFNEYVNALIMHH